MYYVGGAIGFYERMKGVKMSRPLEAAVYWFDRTGMVMATTGFVNLSGGRSELGGLRCFIVGERVANRRFRIVPVPDDLLGVTLSEQQRIEKFCPRCQEFYAATHEHWYEDPKGKYRLYYICKDCKRQDTHSRTSRNKKKHFNQIIPKT